MRVTSLGFRTDLMVRRLAGSQIISRANHVVVRTPTNPTFWWGNFLVIDRPLAAGDAENVRALMAAELPGVTTMAIGINGTANDAGQASEIAALDLEVCPDIVLTTEAVSKPTTAPRGRVHQLLGDDDWAALGVLRSAWQGPSPDVTAERFRALRLAEARALTETGAAAWFGVTDGDELVSALGIASDGDGLARYQDVETHPDHRRRGHARQLLHAAAMYAERDLSAKTLVIVADPTYHAIDLYRSVGFHDAEWQVKLQPATSGED